MYIKKEKERKAINSSFKYSKKKIIQLILLKQNLAREKARESEITAIYVY